VVPVSPLHAQEARAASVPHRHVPMPAAKAQFDRATTLLAHDDTIGALAALRRAIESDPNYFAAHDQFVALTQAKILIRDDANFERTLALATAALETQYATWGKRFPNAAGIPYGMGASFIAAEDPRAKPYLLRAVQLDPKLAKAYEMLSEDASRWGDETAARDFEAKAVAADPANAEYAFSYAWDFHDSDPGRWRELTRDLVRRFPTSEQGAEALFFLGREAPSDSERVAIFEQVRRQYPADKFRAAGGATYQLFDGYTRIAPDKALALAEDALRATADPEDQPAWAIKVVFARNLILARSLLADHKDAAAWAVLGATRVPKYSENDEMVALLEASAAAGSGKTQVAYDSLVARFAKTPTDSLRAAIVRYGEMLGNGVPQIDSAVWSLRDSAAKAAPPFKLGLYTSADSASLAGYKGKVVLLTFWFPGCGPCRGEFPHFQKVVNEFKGRDLAYVGINVLPEQDPYVLPFMRGTQYGFTPLRGTPDFATQTYHVRGEPTNFLIDRQGRIVFADFMIEDAAGERTLHNMIESTLGR
jgi:thiol-disulfide isomerase/thioredoxin/Tfp pilus assembly protein PilF